MLGACAPIVPPSLVNRPPAAARDTAAKAPATATATTAPARPAGVATPAASDLTPSADAREVLDSIPEPLPPGERVAADTSGDIPVPAQSWALGQQPPRAPDDSLGATPGMAPPSTTGAHGAGASGAGAAPGAAGVAGASTARPGGAPPPSPSTPDSCWRVQVAAPEEREKGDQLRAASESVLLVPMVVELEKNLYKVRTRDCMNAEVAARLKTRAENSGFDGAFRFVMPKAPAKKEPR